MIAQDTGSAIVGPARGDLFAGSGDAAGEIAGVVKASGRLLRAIAARPGRELAHDEPIPRCELSDEDRVLVEPGGALATPLKGKPEIERGCAAPANLRHLAEAAQQAAKTRPSRIPPAPAALNQAAQVQHLDKPTQKRSPRARLPILEARVDLHGLTPGRGLWLCSCPSFGRAHVRRRPRYVRW
jgi:hypothetical protein